MLGAATPSGCGSGRKAASSRRSSSAASLKWCAWPAAGGRQHGEAGGEVGGSNWAHACTGSAVQPSGRPCTRAQGSRPRPPTWHVRAGLLAQAALQRQHAQHDQRLEQHKAVEAHAVPAGRAAQGAGMMGPWAARRGWRCGSGRRAGRPAPPAAAAGTPHPRSMQSLPASPLPSSTQQGSHHGVQALPQQRGGEDVGSEEGGGASRLPLGVQPHDAPQLAAQAGGLGR